MKVLRTFSLDLPDIYLSWKWFLTSEVGGDDDSGGTNSDEGGQMEFVKEVNAEIQAEKARRKGKGRAEEESSPDVDDLTLNHGAGSPAGEEN